jgi:hypothetical protein
MEQNENLYGLQKLKSDLNTFPRFFADFSRFSLFPFFLIFCFVFASFPYRFASDSMFRINVKQAKKAFCALKQKKFYFCFASFRFKA